MLHPTRKFEKGGGKVFAAVSPAGRRGERVEIIDRLNKNHGRNALQRTQVYDRIK
jgi:hypothetical protein